VAPSSTRSTSFGSSAANTLRGGRGADPLDGGGGNDILDRGRGNDTLDGGEGPDRALFDGRWADTTWRALSADTIEATGAAFGIDTLRAIEWLVFDDITVDRLTLIAPLPPPPRPSPSPRRHLLQRLADERLKAKAQDLPARRRERRLCVQESRVGRSGATRRRDGPEEHRQGRGKSEQQPEGDRKRQDGAEEWPLCWRSGHDWINPRFRD
jgi:hypothetical protein